MTEPAVRSVLSRARKALRKEFATRGGTLPAGGLVALAPWLDGLTWLDRLRSAVTRTTAPAALGVATLGLVGGAALGPWGTDIGTATPPRVTAASAAPSYEVALAHASVPPSPTTARLVAPAVRAPAPVAAPPAAETITAIEKVGIRDTCSAESGARAGGVSCAEPVNRVLHVGPSLPDNPTGIGRVGVESNKIRCEHVPTLPMTQCTEEGDAR